MSFAIARDVVASVPLRPSARQPGPVARLVRAIARSIAIHRRRRMLQQMPDFLLKDIGISRSDIDYVVRASVDGRLEAALWRGRGANQ